MEVFLIFSLLVLLPSTFSESNTQSDALIPPKSSFNSLKEDVYIVYLSVTPPTPLGPEAYIKLLSSILGSENAAKEALIYSYNFGFAAKLTTEQVERLQKRPEVKFVQKDPVITIDEPWGTNFAPQELGQ